MVLNASVEQVIFVGVVQIDGSPVYIRSFRDIVDRDLFQLLLPKKLQKALLIASFVLRIRLSVLIPVPMMMNLLQLMNT